MERYRGRVSGPLLDRIDLHINVTILPPHELSGDHRAESSAAIRERVIAARKRQWQRNRSLNAHLRGADLRTYAALGAESTTLLEGVVQGERMSARSYDRIIRVARTIADLAGSEQLARGHLSEALLYRRT